MASTNGPSATFTAAAAQSEFEQAIALSLYTWPALSLAVQNSWGGEDSSDKRDWFAGAVSDLFAPFERILPATGLAAPKPAKNSTQPPEEPDTEWVEEFLLNVMMDEFEVNVDDDSAYNVAAQIVRLRGDCAKGKFEGVGELRTKWQANKGKSVKAVADPKQGEADDAAEGDSDDSGDWEDDGGEDVNMDEAPQLVSAPKEKPPPEVDEDGFTKVTKKR